MSYNSRRSRSQKGDDTIRFLLQINYKVNSCVDAIKKNRFLLKKIIDWQQETDEEALNYNDGLSQSSETGDKEDKTINIGFKSA